MSAENSASKKAQSTPWPPFREAEYQVQSTWLELKADGWPPRFWDPKFEAFPVDQYPFTYNPKQTFDPKELAHSFIKLSQLITIPQFSLTEVQMDADFKLYFGNANLWIHHHELRLPTSRDLLDTYQTYRRDLKKTNAPEMLLMAEALGEVDTVRKFMGMMAIEYKERG